MNTNPYQAPQLREGPVAGLPGPMALIGSIGVALFLGGIVFLGTCFGSGLLLFSVTYGSSYEGILFLLVWGGSALLGVLTAIFVGRRMYAGALVRAAARTRQDSDQEDA